MNGAPGAQSVGPPAPAAAAAVPPNYKLALIANYDGVIDRGLDVVNPNSIVLDKFYGVASEINPFVGGNVITTAGDQYSTTQPQTIQLADIAQVNTAFEPFETAANSVDYDGKIANYITTAQSSIKSVDFTNNNVIIIYLRAKKVGDIWNTVKSDGSAEVDNVTIGSADVNNRIYITDANAAVLKTDKTVADPNKKYYQIRIIDNDVKIYKDGILVKYALTGEVKTTLAYLLTKLLGDNLTFNGVVVNPPDVGNLGNKTGQTTTVNGGKKSKKQRRKGGKKSKKRRSMRRLKRSRARK